MIQALLGLATQIVPQIIGAVKEGKEAKKAKEAEGGGGAEGAAGAGGAQAQAPAKPKKGAKQRITEKFAQAKSPQEVEAIKQQVLAKVAKGGKDPKGELKQLVEQLAGQKIAQLGGGAPAGGAPQGAAPIGGAPQAAGAAPMAGAPPMAGAAPMAGAGLPGGLPPQLAGAGLPGGAGPQIAGLPGGAAPQIAGLPGGLPPQLAQGGMPQLGQPGAGQDPLANMDPQTLVQVAKQLIAKLMSVQQPGGPQAGPGAQV